MKAIQQDFNMDFLLKRAIKKIIPELKEVEEFELKKVKQHCSTCGEKTADTWSYKLPNADTWKIHQMEMKCDVCAVWETINQDNDTRIEMIKERIMTQYWCVPNNLKEAGFKNYEQTKKINAEAYSSCVEYYNNFINSEESKRYNLLLMGNPGTGKTHLSIAIARSLKQKGFTVGFITTGRLLALIKETYHKSAAKTEEEILTDLSRFDLLVIDDLGSETFSKDEFSWTKTKLFEIVNSRIGKATIYTTNFDEDVIGGAVGERVASRLNIQTEFIKIFSNDYRKNFRINKKGRDENE